MNKYVIFQRMRSNLPRFCDQIAAYGMLDKMPTINPPVDPIEIEDKPVVTDPRQNNSKAMRVYMENVSEYNRFMTEQRAAFEIGKRHLANMMGCDPETFTQNDIDEAIAYLFPCGLFEKKARPLMKPPEVIFPPKKEAEFDVTGRPFHFLFYTFVPNFYQIIHDYVKVVKELDDFEDRVIRGEVDPPEDNTLMLDASHWLSKEDLQKLCFETISKAQYQSFCQVMERLVEHKYAKRAESFIMKYRLSMQQKLSHLNSVAPVLLENGRQQITTEWNSKRKARAHVTVTYPGSGKINIEGQGLEFFSNIRCKEQPF